MGYLDTASEGLGAAGAIPNPASPFLLAGAFGAKLAAGLLGNRSEKRRKARITQLQLEALRPLENRLVQANFGASQSEGSLLNALTQRTLVGLADRGVLNGSGAAGEVAGAIAPVEAARQNRLDELTARIASIKANIYGDSATPGMEDAFAGSLGSLGNLLAYKYGRGGTTAGATTGTPAEGGVQTDQNNLRTLDPAGFGQDQLAMEMQKRAQRKRPQDPNQRAA
jgi:hypothetical protein